MTEGEVFNRALHAEYYQSGAGLKSGLEVTPIYAAHQALFEGERFEEARHWGLEPVEERYIQDFIANGYLHFRTKEIDESLAAREAAATVEWDERPIAYRDVPPLIANEADPVRRHALEQRYFDVMATFNPQLQEREKRAQREARGFGYTDYVALYDAVRGIDIDDLTKAMQAFIEATNDLYFDALDTYLSEMRILRVDARKCDLARLFRATHFDAFFPGERLIDTLHSTLRELGILLEDQKNIRLDTEPRPLKSPRAFCSPLAVPDDVRLVLKPSGGLQDYETLRHEAGHAEHFGNVDPTMAFAYRWLGDYSVTESYAFLLQYLLLNESWLQRQLGYAHPVEYLRLAGFHKLYFLRRYGTKLIYEQVLHGADEPGDVSNVYEELFARNVGIGYGTESYLTDVDDGFYCAQYLKAWIFEVQHRQYLLREFDDEWHRNPKAGRFLIDLWREGQRHPVEKLARFMGYPGLDMRPVTEEIRTLLGG